jgi:hypothetical protein
MRRRLHDWEELLAELDSSGLSRAEFCRQRNLNYATMSKWVSRRSQSVQADSPPTNRRRRRTGQPARFVEVSLADRPGPTGYEVLLRAGRTIRVPAEFDAEAVARLIQTVESC